MYNLHLAALRVNAIQSMVNRCYEAVKITRNVIMIIRTDMCNNHGQYFFTMKNIKQNVDLNNKRYD